MVLTSPPYDNLRTYQGFTFDFEPLAHELFRVLKDGGVCVWVVGDSTKKFCESLVSFEQAIYFVKNVGFNLNDTMVYKKGGYPFPVGHNHTKYANAFEYMFVLAKGKPSAFNQIKDKPNTTAKQIINIKERQPSGCLTPAHGNGKIIAKTGARTNVWTYYTGYMLSTKDKIAFQHPASFPEKLAEDHILSWSNPGDVILDPMCGSGTTCKMAVKHQRQYVGIDIAEKYCQIAEERIRKFTQQTNMFDVAGYNNCVQRTSKPRAAVEIPARY